MSEKGMHEEPLSSPSKNRVTSGTLPMAGKVVLITGATGGIGKATAIGLAALAPGSVSRVVTSHAPNRPRPTSVPHQATRPSTRSPPT